MVNRVNVHGGVAHHAKSGSRAGPTWALEVGRLTSCSLVIFVVCWMRWSRAFVAAPVACEGAAVGDLVGEGGVEFSE